MLKRKSNNFLIALVIGIYILGCKKDDAAQSAMVSFDKSRGRNNYTAIERTPRDLILSSASPAIIIDKPLSADLKISIESSGTATPGKDFSFNSTVLIPQGRTAADIGLIFIDDSEPEYSETIHFKITSTNNPLVKIDTVVSHVTITDDETSELSANLFWTPYTDPSGAYYDMDLYLWRESSPGSNTFELVSKDADHYSTAAQDPGSPSGNIHEHVSLGVLAKDGRYAISMVYFAGESDNLAVQLNLIASGLVTMEGSPKIMKATYRLLNRNQGQPSARELYFTKKGPIISDVTEIVVPANGS